MRRNNLNGVIGVRLDARDVRLLREIARLRGLKVSQLARQIILEWLGRHSYLNEDRKKALGIGSQERFGTRGG